MWVYHKHLTKYLHVVGRFLYQAFAMKTRSIAAIIVLGALTVLVGALYKILHWEGSKPLLIAGLGLEGIGVLLILVRALGKPKTRDVLDS